MLEACQSEEAGGGTTGKVQIGDEVPAFELTDTDGATVSSSSLSGQVYLLSFFDTGCPDCRKEFPVLQQIYDKYNGSVAVINVPRSQTVSEVSQYWTDSGLSMPVYYPNDKRLYYKFADSGIPRIYVVDGKGIVQSVYRLSDNSGVKFTTDQYILPGGDKIHGVGIEPTVQVEFEEFGEVTSSLVNFASGEETDILQDNQIMKAVEMLEQ